MVQCGKCDHWIHATCESISDETYEILSELPEDSVVFNCRLCAPQPPGVVPPWRQAITDYTLESFAKVSACYNLYHTAKKNFIVREISPNPASYLCIVKI